MMIPYRSARARWLLVHSNRSRLSSVDRNSLALSSVSAATEVTTRTVVPPSFHRDMLPWLRSEVGTLASTRFPHSFHHYNSHSLLDK